MEIYYQGTEITGMVQTRRCIVRDGCGGRCDSLELEFENAAGWRSWGPQEDDQVSVSHNGYDSGIMYVNAILPQDGKYRIMAAALPCRARRRASQSFIGRTLEEIMRSCAFSSGMGFQMHGLAGSTLIPYIERGDEGCAAFLCRLLELEGAVLKCVNGKYAAIGIGYAQERAAGQTMELSPRQEGVQYKRAGTAYKSITVRTPYAEATAEDTAAAEDRARITLGCLPAMDDVQAGRWARGKLLHLNRQSESVTVQSEFNPGLSAMARIDIAGDTDAAGQWLVEEAEHDLISMTTSVRMHRCIWTVR